MSRIERIHVRGRQRCNVLSRRGQIQILIRVIREPLYVVEALRRVFVLTCFATDALRVYVVDV